MNITVNGITYHVRTEQELLNFIWEFHFVDEPKETFHLRIIPQRKIAG